MYNIQHKIDYNLKVIDQPCSLTPLLLVISDSLWGMSRKGTWE